MLYFFYVFVLLHWWFLFSLKFNVHKYIEKNTAMVKFTYLIYAMLYPHCPDVKIYSPNLFLNYYRFLYPIFRSFLRGLKVLKSEFTVEAIIIFVNSIKKGIQWYIHLIWKPVILFVPVLPKSETLQNRSSAWIKYSKIVFNFTSLLNPN